MDTKDKSQTLKETKTIQLFRPEYNVDIPNALARIFDSGWTGLGPKTEEFENAVATYLDTPHAIAFNSCTAALQVAIFALRLPRGSLVIITPITFISTNHCIIHAGYYPIFADVDPTTGNIDGESVKRLLVDPFLKGRIKAIIMVHYGGEPVAMEELYDVANENELIAIEDAAHAFGSTYQNKNIGCGLSGLVCFSFHAVKPLAIGDGGMLTTHSDIINDFARKMRWCGIDKSTTQRTVGSGYSWDYNVVYTGFKSHMNDIQAVIGLKQLEQFDNNQNIKQSLVDYYRENLERIKGVTLLAHDSQCVSANHLMPILIKNRDEVMQHLADNGIQTGVHYRPSTHYSMYKRFESDNGCPNANEFFKKELSLPLHLHLTKDDIDYICNKIEEVVKC